MNRPQAESVLVDISISKLCLALKVLRFLISTASTEKIVHGSLPILSTRHFSIAACHRTLEKIGVDTNLPNFSSIGLSLSGEHFNILDDFLDRNRDRLHGIPLDVSSFFDLFPRSSSVGQWYVKYFQAFATNLVTLEDFT